MMSAIGAIVLAAGASSRMGQPKQLLDIGGETLLHKTVRVAIEAGIHPVIVVLGANEQASKTALSGLDCYIIQNEDWAKGMGSSLKRGLTFLLTMYPNINGFINLVCDQPFVNVEHLNSLIAMHNKTFSPIVASGYANTIGVPVLFSNKIFSQLLELNDQAGAKKIITANTALTSIVDFPQGQIDLDTPEDYTQFINNSRISK